MASLKLEEKSKWLREALDQVAAIEPNQVPRQPTLVATLRSRCPHGIEIADDPEVANIPLDQFTCFVHALGLAESRVVERIARALDRGYISSDFVAFLVGHLFESVSTEEARDGDIVLYWNDKTITHTGKVRSERVISKWGTGYLWQHDVFEVPMRYGSRVTFYRPLDRPVVEQAFVTYLKQREGATLIDELLTEG